MDVLGLGYVTFALFVGFGLLIGVLFGFFGMGGSFLVTPVLLVLGYPATEAVGSGLAFVFGTSVIGALRHRAHDQVDSKLASVMILGMTLGIMVGKRAVFLFDELGTADVAIRVVYVVLLGVVGLVVRWNARTGGASAGWTRVETAIRAIGPPPLMELPGGATVSMWLVLAIGLGIGGLSGFLGVGGGFLALPIMIYGFGVPTTIAVGTGTLQVVVTGGFGTFVFALSNAVHVPVVAALLCGSALGARVGASATRLVPAAYLQVHFAVVLLAASVATAGTQVGDAYGVETIETASVILIVGVVLFVVGSIVHASFETFAENRERGSPLTH